MCQERWERGRKESYSSDSSVGKGRKPSLSCNPIQNPLSSILFKGNPYQILSKFSFVWGITIPIPPEHTCVGFVRRLCWKIWNLLYYKKLELRWNLLSPFFVQRTPHSPQFYSKERTLQSLSTVIPLPFKGTTVLKKKTWNWCVRQKRRRRWHLLLCKRWYLLPTFWSNEPGTVFNF
jgi:hypothetical protein